MEEDPEILLTKSKILQKESVQKQFEKLKHAIEVAEDRIDYESAHDPEILFALKIIRSFLVKRERVCYGGTAINALLPKSLQFYDTEKSLPDYDFFTPSMDKDIDEIVKALEKAGFTEVNERIGIHKGTKKIMVNFVPIADITELGKDLYTVIHRRSVNKEGIHYCDADFLRMMMYLELSRPKGQVSRWEKVYERLTLLNSMFPMKECHIKGKSSRISPVVKALILEHIITNKRILMGAEITAIYNKALHVKKYRAPPIQWFLKHGLLVFYSPDILIDSMELREKLDKYEVKIETLRGFTDFIPDRILLYVSNKPVALLVQEVACNSYNTIPLNNHKNILIGSLDSMITLYFLLHIFTRENHILGYSMLCLCQKLIELNAILKKREDDSPFPAFSIECSGYQKGFSTLLREKAKRIEKEKAKKTRKNTKDHHRKTRKNKNIH